jgi:hypothetical protein
MLAEEEKATISARMAQSMGHPAVVFKRSHVIWKEWTIHPHCGI